MLQQKKIWKLAPRISPEQTAPFLEVHPILAQILVTRGITTQEAADAYIQPDYSVHVHDPFLFRHMHIAVDRIEKAIAADEKILVYGDYDGDGICGSTLLVSALKTLGAQHVDVYLPHRSTEGYGLNEPAVKKIAEQGVTLMITVDCGTTSVKETALANSLGMDVIIIDHHAEPEQLPEALALINPSVSADAYPTKFLCGTGVAFKVVQALFRERAKKDGDVKKWEAEEKWLLDLVAIATIMDMIPLIGESRMFVKYGLMVMKKTRRIGLRELYAQSHVDPQAIDARTIGFQLGPRINAAGRMQHASVASALFMAESPEVAKQYAMQLDQANQDRQRLVAEMMEEAEAQISRRSADEKMLVAYKEGWEAGVVGLVAGKFLEKYRLPVLIMGQKANGEVIGSGRSVEQFNITEALRASSEFLAEFGGHPQACGFTLKSHEMREQFVAAMQKIAAEKLEGVDLRPVLDIEAEVNVGDITWQLYDAIAQLEPYGQKSPQPKFVLRNVELVSADAVGQDGKHVRLMIRQFGISKRVIAFGFAEQFMDVTPGTLINCIVELGVNQWNGNRELQIKLVDAAGVDAVFV